MHADHQFVSDKREDYNLPPSSSSKSVMADPAARHRASITPIDSTIPATSPTAPTTEFQRPASPPNAYPIIGGGGGLRERSSPPSTSSPFSSSPSLQHQSLLLQQQQAQQQLLLQQQQQFLQQLQQLQFLQGQQQFFPYPSIQPQGHLPPASLPFPGYVGAGLGLGDSNSEKKVRKLKDKIEALEKELSEIKEQLTTEQSQKAEIKSKYKKQKKKWQKELNSKNELSENMEKQLQDKEIEISDLEQKYQREKEENKRLQQEVGTLKKELRSLSDKFSQLEREEKGLIKAKKELWGDDIPNQSTASTSTSTASTSTSTSTSWKEADEDDPAPVGPSPEYVCPDCGQEFAAFNDEVAVHVLIHEETQPNTQGIPPPVPATTNPSTSSLFSTATTPRSNAILTSTSSSSGFVIKYEYRNAKGTATGLSPRSTVKQLREAIGKAAGGTVTKIFFGGKCLKEEEKTLEELGIRHDMAVLAM